MLSLKKKLPSIQNGIGTQGRGNNTVVDHETNGLQDSTRATNFTMEDRRSSGLQRNSEAGNALKTWGNRPKKCFMQEQSRHMSRQRSVDFIRSEQNHDMVTGANHTPHMVPEFLTGRPMQSRNPL